MASRNDSYSRRPELVEYDFVEQPPLECFCPVTLSVLREPYQTQCCRNHLSQDAHERLARDGKPCPVCRKENYSATEDPVKKRKVLSLKLRCPHKKEGCGWEGELGSLEEHLNVYEYDNAEASAEGLWKCEYENVDCPYACGERVQRRDLEEHKSQHCPLRPFTCQYCNHKATHQEVTKDHWPVCDKYPLPCPNECGEEEIERQHLKGHLEQTCPLEVIKCEFSYAGCGAQLQRRLMPAHMKESTETHLSLVAQVSKDVPKLIQEQRDQIKQQSVEINRLWDQVNKQADLIRQQGKVLVEQSDQEITLFPNFTPPATIVMDDFEEHRTKDKYWYSPPFYSHVGGYKMCLRVDANGLCNGKGTHVSVFVYIMRGEFDDRLQWPFHGAVTIQLKRKDPPNYQWTIDLQGTGHGRQSLNSDEQTFEERAAFAGRGEGNQECIAHTDLYNNGYLENNKLVFCISDIVIY